MIARLVEKGVIDWNSSIADIFPVLTPDGNPAAKITLSQLLSHTSGLTENMDDADFAKYEKSGYVDCETARRQRLSIAKKYLNAPLLAKPGQKFLYSNLGYLIAAAMVEKATGQSWGRLIRRQIFATLNLRSAGLGPPGYAQTPGGQSRDQPQGHMPAARTYG
ncbi:serine hydrolase domain-containing protein [Varunaivibrio sulfuroxidans]|uniref:Beta-lactamase n=2 Tax=Varunaivibrio sulfuroxidans TaxID=1773489 RepID=A0A4R3J5E5_9PROT|nr:serine hydrolase domain-containing protein [Varunaivibrio sulfuroxidans]TCS60535.1 beta-lactamase [Varunaivibrio sulfuroxidans]WES30025.1 serine hydrolase [Varunaivibrio sulfuroxidans]